MKRSTLLTSLVLGGTLAIGAAWLVPTFASENRTGTEGERQWLSIPQVHAKLEAAGYRHIEKIERERGGYEVRATDRNGERVKLYLNPQTGDSMNQRGDGKRLGNRDGEGGRVSSANCSERRCRDDLPPKPVGPASAAR